MQTRCPYPDCLHTFPHPEQRHGTCERCQRPMTFRQLDVLQDCDRRKTRISESLPTHCQPNIGVPVISAIVEDVRSLWNVGSIFRTADGAGVTHLYLCGICGTPPRKEIAKVSLGAEDSITWSYHATALEPLMQLKAQGVFILGLERTSGREHGAPQSTDLRQALTNGSVRFPLCLAAGNEVTGVSAEVLSLCDAICHLPMRGMKESLNVAVAFGIASYLIAEQCPALTSASAASDTNNS